MVIGKIQCLVNDLRKDSAKNNVDTDDNHKEIELQKGDLYLQWRYVGETEWRNIIAYSDLKGEKGETGANGATGAQGETGANGTNGLTGPAGAQGQPNSLKIGTVTAGAPGATLSGTAPNQILNLSMPYSPAGGLTGQLLMKNSDSDYDVSWTNGPIIRGHGEPEGKVAASIGTKYIDLDRTYGKVEYLKTVNDGATGWKLTFGETDWYKINDLFTSSQFTIRDTKTNQAITADDSMKPVVAVRRTTSAWEYRLSVANIPANSYIQATGQSENYTAVPGASINGYVFYDYNPTSGTSAMMNSYMYQFTAQNTTNEAKSYVTYGVVMATSGGEDWPTTIPGTKIE